MTCSTAIGSPGTAHFMHQITRAHVQRSETGIRLFGLRIGAAGSTAFLNVDTMRLAIEAIQGPVPDPALSSARTWSPPAGAPLPNLSNKHTRQALSIGMAVVGLVAAFIIFPFLLLGSIVLWITAYALWPRTSREDRASVTRQHSAASAAWQGALGRWRREASEVRFVEGRDRLLRAHRELAGLPEERRQRIATLERQREERQLVRYLDRFRIDRAGIRGIGPGRAAMLASYGIETAADVNYNKIMSIPGFGDSLTTQLLEWQHRQARKFRFNPNEPVDRRDIDALDGELEARRQSLLQTLRQGPDALRRTSQEIIAARTRLMPVLDEAWTTLKIAETWRSSL